jgi:hypothetical protein
MRPRFLVVLTWVRPAIPAGRDEVKLPERIVEAVGAVDPAAADRLFRTMCALPLVRAGRQRAKVIDLAGSDHWQPSGWVAPLVTDATRRALLRIGVRRKRSWH